MFITLMHIYFFFTCLWAIYSAILLVFKLHLSDILWLSFYKLPFSILALWWYMAFWFVHFHCYVVFHLNISDTFMIVLCVESKVISNFSLWKTGLLRAFLQESCASVRVSSCCMYKCRTGGLSSVHIFTHGRCCQGLSMVCGRLAISELSPTSISLRLIWPNFYFLLMFANLKIKWNLFLVWICIPRLLRLNVLFM